jgi:hypothetical protein
MIREKYKADVDSVLKDVFNKTATSLKTIDVIEYSDALAENHTIKKLAFDLYQVDNDPYHSLWLKEDIDGKPYLVRTSDPSYSTKELGSWSAISDYEHRNVTLAYKNVPIARFSSEDHNFDPNDVGSFKKALLELTSQDIKFVKDILAEQPVEKRQALVSTFPELSKFI